MIEQYGPSYIPAIPPPFSATRWVLAEQPRGECSTQKTLRDDKVDSLKITMCNTVRIVIPRHGAI